MSAGLDTSVVLRLLTGTPANQAETARDFVGAANAPVFVSDLVIGEAYDALMHHYGVPHVEAVRALCALLADPHVQGSGVSTAVLAAVASRPATRTAPGVLDELIHADYARDDIALVTFDKHLSRLSSASLLK